VAAFNDNGSYLAIGAQKSVQTVEGSPAVRGRNMALIVESMFFYFALNFLVFLMLCDFLAKKTPFHMVEGLFTKANRLIRDIHNLRNGDFDKLNKTVTGKFDEL